ncbi:MAG: DUF721 domain-containing protein [Alphaproteobacteria bacterium]
MPLRSIQSLTSRIARQTLGAKGAAVMGLTQDWRQIAGPTLSQLTWPARIQKGRNGMNGTLTLYVRGAGAAEVSAARMQLIERINGWFGFAAIGQLKLIQAPLPLQAKKPKPQRPKPLPPEQIERRAEGLSDVEDAELKQALARLSVALEEREKRKRSKG